MHPVQHSMLWSLVPWCNLLTCPRAVRVDEWQQGATGQARSMLASLPEQTGRIQYNQR